MRAPASATNLLAAICSPWASSIGRRQDHAGHLALDPGVVRPIRETSKLATSQIGALFDPYPLFSLLFLSWATAGIDAGRSGCVLCITESRVKTIQKPP
jgi:hypothetical protein